MNLVHILYCKKMNKFQNNFKNFLFVGKPGQKTEACSDKCMRNPGRQASYSAN